MSLTSGSRLGPYEIRAPLGAGGMGEVYKAHDSRLDRHVAIKVLREELASDPERLKRFEQEARAASALDHPNIITIHDIAESNGVHYIVMQYVEGKTLRELLAEGPLPLEKLLDFAQQIAEGLSKAHGAGIIHRDLKPDNLMVTDDGHVKILDFGLAKLMSQPGADSQAATVTKEGTVAGTVMGTASYMSPEQALGDSLDARTDVFSLGSVLYEMTTGRRAFQGETPARLFDRTLHQAPASPTSWNPELPRDFARVISRALEKEPSKRYPSAKELLADLDTVRLDSAHPEAEVQKSIVVLPFENISPDPEQEYFCDGMTEEIIADLSNIRSLRVISRTSSMMFKGTKKDIHTIARDVQVQYVLEGSVRKVENKLRITAQLIDALNDAHLWADKYSGKLEDVFDIQEKVSGSIVDALKLTLSPEEKRRIAEQRIDDINAYECYLRARQETLRWTEEGFTRALKLLQNGLAVLGENAFLYGAIGYTYWQHVSAGFHPSEYDHYLQETERYAKRALALNPNSEQGHLLLGLLSLFRGKRSDLQSTVRSLKRALEIAPDNPDALLWLVAAYTFAGKGFAARPLAQRLLEIDPLNSFSQIIPGWIDYFDGMIEASLDAGRKAHGMEPDNALTCTAYVLFLAGNQRLDEVGSIVNQMANDAPNATATRSVRFLRYALEKDKREATRVLTSELREGARWDLYYSYLIACGHALLEMKEEAIEWLEHAASLGLINYPFLSNYDPLLENVRSDSRFRELMERVKHEWEHFEV